MPMRSTRSHDVRHRVVRLRPPPADGVDVRLLRAVRGHSRACGWRRRAARCASASVNFGGDKVLIDGPYALAIGIAVLGFTGVTVIGSVAGRAVQQDFEYGTYHFFFTAPIGKRDYFFGRLLGAYLDARPDLRRASRSASLIGTHWPGRRRRARRRAIRRGRASLRPYLFLLLPERALARRLLLRARGADAADGARVRRRRHRAGRLPVRDQPAGRHGEQDAGGAGRSVRRDRGRRPHPLLDASRRRTASRFRSTACCCGTARCGSASASSSPRSAIARSGCRR